MAKIILTVFILSCEIAILSLYSLGADIFKLILSKFCLKLLIFFVHFLE